MITPTLTLNDVKWTADGYWVLSKTVAGQKTEFSGTDQHEVLKVAQAHFERVLLSHNKRRQGAGAAAGDGRSELS